VVLNEARDDGGWQWPHLDHMQTICTLIHKDNHTNTSSLNFSGRMLSLTPNQALKAFVQMTSNFKAVTDFPFLCFGRR